MFARASAGRFLPRMIFDLLRAGIAECGDPALIGKGALSLGSPCLRGVVTTADLGVR